MINSIKKFRDQFDDSMMKVIVVFVSLIAIFYTVSTGSTIWNLFKTLFPVLLVALAAIGLQYKGKSLAAHLVLIMTYYLGAARTMLNALTSFNFASMSFGSGFSIEMIVGFIIFVYLLIYILSFVFNNDTKSEFKKSAVVTSAIIAFTYFFLRSGFNVAVLKLIPPIIALYFGMDLFAIILLLAGVADVPFELLNRIFTQTSTLSSQPISYYIFTAFGLYLAYGATTGIIKAFRKSK
ncbi:MAG: hypothetical protein JXC31_05075 [Acholeplasmataceae bacterium]|nr:hypothetical protein [Acholeplasmataceae bacterium]